MSKLPKQYCNFGHDSKPMIKFEEDPRFAYYYCPRCGKMVTYHIGVHGLTEGKWDESVFQVAVEQGIFTRNGRLRERRL